MFASPSARRNFFKCAPPNLKSWIRPWLKCYYVLWLVHLHFAVIDGEVVCGISILNKFIIVFLQRYSNNNMKALSYQPITLWSSGCHIRISFGEAQSCLNNSPKLLSFVELSKRDLCFKCVFRAGNITCSWE